MGRARTGRSTAKQPKLEQRALQAASREVYRRFPEVSGQKPQVKVQATAGDASPTYLLVFKGEALTANGKRLLRWVRVVVDARGKILKITTSH